MLPTNFLFREGGAHTTSNISSEKPTKIPASGLKEAGGITRLHSAQKINLNPNCSTRAELAVLVTLPKPLLLLTSLPGEPKMTVLKRLNASARNSSFRPSPDIGNPRKSERSKFQ